MEQTIQNLLCGDEYMTKQKNLATEVCSFGEVQDIRSKILAIQDQIAKKQQALDAFQQQIDQRQIEADSLKEHAGHALLNGEDPLPVLDQVGTIEYQLRGMEALAEDAEPGEAEYREIKQLEKDLAQAIRRAVRQSQALEDHRNELTSLFREIESLFHRWTKEELEAYHQYGIQPVSHSLLQLKDKSLARFARGLADSGRLSVL